MTGFNYAPEGWALCNGQLLSIEEYSTLFTLIGTTYGGDGQTNFAVPNLQSRVPVHQGTDPQGNQYVVGQNGGAEQVNLGVAQMAGHSHQAVCNPSPGAATPGGNVWSNTSGDQYSNAAPNQTLNPASVQLVGQGLPHDNMPPLLVINFIIALQGVYPSQS